jgi:hypothetical protein
MASVNYSTSSATIEAEEGMELDEDELLAAVANTNHAIDSMQYAAAIANRSDFNSERVLAVEGMMCAESCAPTVQAALEAVVGTAHVEVCGILAAHIENLSTCKLFQVSYEDKLARVIGQAPAFALIEAIQATGFGATELHKKEVR